MAGLVCTIGAGIEQASRLKPQSSSGAQIVFFVQAQELNWSTKSVADCHGQHAADVFIQAGGNIPARVFLLEEACK